MVPLTDAEELQAAWRALAVGSEDDASEGWRTIPVATDLPAKVRAGRHFPRGCEALLVGFRGPTRIPAGRLPVARGFEVSVEQLPSATESLCWIALSRSEAGAVELFAEMAADLLRTVRLLRVASEVRLMKAFLDRIGAWQEFMERSRASLPGTDAETGLFGELLMLAELLTELSPAEAIASWRGPLRSLRDFEIGSGSIEVKSSLSVSEFPALISSLEQLETLDGRELCVCAVRLSAGRDAGRTLPELVQELTVSLGQDAEALERFNALLLRAGFIASESQHYDRRFHCESFRLIEVTDAFPRLVRSRMMPAILSATYMIDLDRVQSATASLSDLLTRWRAC